MRVFVSAMVILLAFHVSAVRAQESFPDLRGTWTGKGEGIFVASPGAKTDSHFSQVDVTVVIDKQEDRRFGGTITMVQETKPMVGVITWDGGILWSEPGGFVEGKLTDPDTFEGCFVRVNAYSQLAACEVLKRQK